MTADLIVLGAGPAGLGATYSAASKGRKVVLLEKADRVGGAAGSFVVSGVRVDVGSHRLHPSIDPEILATLRKLLGSDLQLRKRHGRMRIAGRWVHFPLRGGDAMRRLPPGLSLAMVRDAVLTRGREATEDTYEQVLLQTLGPALCERFYFPYARKIWGREPSELAGEQARKRVSAGSLWDVAKRAFSGSKEGGREGAGHFLYPKRGYGQISEALATAAEIEGADIRLRSAVTKIDLGEDDVRVETEVGDQIEGRMLFSSLPITGLVRFCSNVHADVAEAAQDLSFRSMILVYLVLESARYSEYDAHYFPEEWTQVTRVSEPKNYRSGDDPSDRTVLCAEIPCDRDDAMWSARDDALRDAVVSSLERAGLPEPRPIDTQVHRLPYAYPIYDLDYERRFDAVDAWASSQPRLITFGRQGLFVHDNAHHALAMAWEAAERLGADGDFDHAGWARARERFKLHVVED